MPATAKRTKVKYLSCFGCCATERETVRGLCSECRDALTVHYAITGHGGAGAQMPPRQPMKVYRVAELEFQS